MIHEEEIKTENSSEQEVLHEHHEHDGHHEEHHHHEHDHHHEEHGHHHHHDESCGCEHDHDEHEHHHHHHDDDCGCGHDHDHEHHHHHHHDDDCGCDHDHGHEGHEHHHHDHGHQYDVPGFRVFETHNHEGATICSFEKDIQKDVQAVRGNMEACIKTLEQWLDEQDATIGHVKGYVKETGSITTFSTVGCGLNVEQHEGGALTVGFAAIVFGPTEEELKDKVAEVFAEV